MEITISKEIRHSLIIDESGLRRLYDFIASRYKEVHLAIVCNDGSKMSSILFDELLSFENSNNRKITELNISARNEYADQLTLEFGALRLIRSAKLYIASQNEEQARFLAHEIENTVAGMKAGYDRLTGISALWDEFFGGMNGADQGLYPRVFFLLGRQKQTMERMSTIRKLIFGGIIFAVVIGLFINWLSAVLFK